MANNLLTMSVIAQEALVVLENQLVYASPDIVHRGYQEEFGKSLNGYTPGSSITIKRPPRYVFRSGQVASDQDTVEGSVAMTLDNFGGVDLKFTQTDLTLNIKEFSERIIKPAMRPIVSAIDLSVAALYKDVYNWVGTPGNDIDSYADYLKVTTRLNQTGVPMDGRRGVLSPQDHAAMLGAMTALYIDDVAKTALQNAKLPGLGSTELYMSQNNRYHTVGTKAGTPLVNGASQSVTYDSVKTTYEQSLITDGWTNSSAILKQGDVFAIAGVYAVNRDSLETLNYLQQFVVKADISANGSGQATLTISPPIIISGGQKTCSAAPADDAAITVLGTASTSYVQNMCFLKEAFALAFAPLERPPGASPDSTVVTDDKTGASIRMIPYYDGTNNVSRTRLDVLWSVKTINADLASRVSGS